MPPTLPRLQDLPPRWARFCLGVEAFSASLGCDFTREGCVVACSGGADSTALLFITTLLCRKNGGPVAAVHLDHGLRLESTAESLFVAELCEKWNIPFVSNAQNVAHYAQEQQIGLEEAGRNARYELFEQVRQAHGARHILVAHQLNDLAEDQLMRLMRGVGWPALGGMAAHDPARFLLRPLLLTPRATLEEFLKDCTQPWQVDQSNFDRVTTRNRVRLDILPALLRENPAYLDAAARLWRQARVDADHDAENVAKLLSALPEQLPGQPYLLPAALLNITAPPLRLRLFKVVLERLGPGQPLANALLRLDELWTQHATGKHLRFPGDKEAVITKSGVRLQVIDRKIECG